MEQARETFQEVVRQQGTVELTEQCPGGLRLFVEDGSRRGAVVFQTFLGRGVVEGLRYEMECGSRRAQGCFDVVRPAEASGTVVRLLQRFARSVYGLDDEKEP
jgi:hypothetical protein